MKKILVDTNFIVSSILPNDDLHSKAVKMEMEENIISSNDCYISNQILSEIMNVLGQKDSVRIAIDTYHMINDNFTIINEYDIPNFNDFVFNTYLRLNKENKKHNLGFTDCAIITVAELFNLDAIVTFDKEFLKNKTIEIIND